MKVKVEVFVDLFFMAKAKFMIAYQYDHVWGHLLKTYSIFILEWHAMELLLASIFT